MRNILIGGTAANGVCRGSCGQKRYCMEQTLKVKERMVLGGILPLEGNALLLKTKKGIIAKIEFSDAERVLLAVEGAKEEDFEAKIVNFTDAEVETIRVELEKLDKTNKLTDDSLPLYEKFIR